MGKLGKTGVVSKTSTRQMIIGHIVAMTAHSVGSLSDPVSVIGYDGYKEERKDATGTYILYSGLAPAVASLFFF